MTLEPSLYTSVLSCPEYIEYILRKPGEQHCFYINFKALPKENYLTVNGDYVEGLIVANKLNDSAKDNELIRVEIEKTTKQAERERWK